MSHDYTNETELKSLLMREKNSAVNHGTTDKNAEINNLIEEYKNTGKPTEIKNKIIELSKDTKIDSKSHEIFGRIVLLMIQKILTKPNFSGYSWRDEFFSTSCYRVFKYLHNFDFEKRSKITGGEVSAFSYITQIITMSILEVINKNNKYSKELEDYKNQMSRAHGLETDPENLSYFEDSSPENIDILVDYEFDSLVDIIEKSIAENPDKEIKIYYPKDYRITYDEYAKISESLKKSVHPVSLIRLSITEAEGSVNEF